VLPEGSRLEQDATYIDLAREDPREFTATGDTRTGRNHRYVPKSEMRTSFGQCHSHGSGGVSENAGAPLGLLRRMSVISSRAAVGREAASGHPREHMNPG
jgi:hypothetical protein